MRAEQVEQLAEESHRVFDELERRYFEAEESIDAHFEAWFERQKHAA